MDGAAHREARSSRSRAQALKLSPQEQVVASEPAVGLPLIAAYEQQLGLKFERRRETTDVLVIDSVARPTPD